MSFTFKLSDVLHYTFRHCKTMLFMAETDTTLCYVFYLTLQNRTDVTSMFNEYSDTSNDNAVQIHG
jgi:hypothetical protein